MPNTYVALRTETVAVATPSVTFNLSGISGYTDLVIVANTATPGAYVVRFNGDSGSNYSWTRLYGNGSSAVSDRGPNQTDITSAWGGSTNNLYVTNIMNYSNTTTYKTALTRINENAYVVAMVGTWRNTAAITSITISNSGSNYPVGCTFSLYGIANADQGAAKATGGIITEDSQYWYHTFGASGAFIPKQSLTCDVLVVAGGGGGAELGGGGGAGGLTYYASQSLTAISHNVTVGAGGIGTNNTTGVAGGNGVNSQFAALTASVGGGGGGRYDATGNSGGSGGGAGRQWTSAATGTVGQGNNGGIGNASWPEVAAGGGGAGAVGQNVQSSSKAGNGGVGISTYSSWGVVTGTGQNISGTYWLAGGGGGGTLYGLGFEGTGGSGGGGNGGYAFGDNAVAGLANTGGGGGGGSGGNRFGKNGGSGLVIVRYAK
jgi:hypothetical protein